MQVVIIYSGLAKILIFPNHVLILDECIFYEQGGPHTRNSEQDLIIRQCEEGIFDCKHL